MGQNDFLTIFGYLRGTEGEGGEGKQSDKNFLSSNPKYDIFFHIWGSWLPNFQGSMTSSQSRHMYTKGTNSIFGYSDGEGGWVAPLSDWAQLASQL